MAKAKKFGVFGGVFTPSILTILGVIMYMRLGWVVGQSGLINTIIIIILAHVISLSTGLSVSSIATDKKIRAGGIYYILSRSLGLPMGGAIGITLFVGTALSISLYLVGFAENFLSIEAVRTFLGLEQDVNGYRIIGTAAVVILVIIAFISTSLAIKTQYYILGFIALSLVSIVIGFATNTHFHPESVVINAATDGLPLELVFAVFFPAVTGFTAGVAMSGDLKNPKKSIPLGTMTAIAVGFVVYIGLAVGMAFFVNRELLLNDINFLTKVAWFSPLVIAGIWGATLSSALGGILGGPRILQAISNDRITPRIFGKGYGINNEPRNALLFIFLIAEAGILIGELNVIAGIVSMFYLASYGFINIAYYLESWASADFRPSFKISRYIGLVGFIAAFGVMFKLDILSMFAALVVMMAIYFILKRKQLKLEYGDVWQSVWSTFMRTALKKMDTTEQVERNWQPNIILFSGGTKKRPHLLELGRSFVGRHGVLSNFDLIEQKDAKVLFPKQKQSLPGETSADGVFTRRQSVKDIYAGIDMIARTYGFSGLEPNTVMLGWVRQTRYPERFAQLLDTLYNLDLNVVLLGYDKKLQFGQRQTIDIWFRDKTNHGNLALNLGKFLLLSEKWENARIRVLFVNSVNERIEIIHKGIDNILDSMRIQGEIKIMNNQIEKRPFYDIVEEESKQSDLVFMNIPDFKDKDASEFVEETNKLLSKIGTVVFLKASTSFKKLKFGLEPSGQTTDQKALESPKFSDIPVIDPALKSEAAAGFNLISKNIVESLFTYFNHANNLFFKRTNTLLDAVEEVVLKPYTILDQRLGSVDSKGVSQLISQLKSGMLVRLGKLIEEQKKLISTDFEDLLTSGTNKLFKEVDEHIGEAPDKITVPIYRNDLVTFKPKKLWSKIYKTRTGLLHSKKLKRQGVPHSLRFRKIAARRLPVELQKTMVSFYEMVGKFSIVHIYELQKLLHAASDSLLYLEKQSGEKISGKVLSESRQNIESHLTGMGKLIRRGANEAQRQLMSETEHVLIEFGGDLHKISADSIPANTPGRSRKEFESKISIFPEKWIRNQQILLESLHLESRLILLDYRLYRLIQESLVEISNIVTRQISEPVGHLISDVDKSLRSSKDKNDKFSHPVTKNLQFSSKRLNLNMSRVVEKIFRNIKSVLRSLPESVVLFTEKSTNELTNNLFDDAETLKLPVFRLVDINVQNNLIAPLVNANNELQESIQQTMNKVADSARLININLEDPERASHADAYDFSGDYGDFLKEQKEKIQQHETYMREAISNFSQSIITHLKRTTDELNIYRMVKSLDESTQFLAVQKNLTQRQRIRTQLKRTSQFAQQLQARIWHSRSDAQLLAKKISEADQDRTNTINNILNLKEMVSPAKKTLTKLPFYYQQLFTSKYNYQNDFWSGRQSELQEARKAIQRHRLGFQGILIITGAWRSGKSFFANYLAGKQFAEDTIFTISAPPAGSTDPDVLNDTFREACNAYGNVSDILNAVPDRSVFILDDVELWWEKAENGTVLLDKLLEVFKEFSQKHFFILTFNNIAYQVIDEQISFSHLALHTVELQPFNSRELEDIIMFRHRTSGFDLQVNRTLPAGLTLVSQARLFSKIFRSSEGNIGSALLCWIANVRDFSKNTVFIQTPPAVDVKLLENIGQNGKVYLMMFLLHKRLTVEKLCRIFREQEENVLASIVYLKRCGLINELAGQVFEIDPYLYPQVRKFILDDN